MTKPTLTDKDWQDYDLLIQYLESLNLRSKEDVDNALRSLKSELKDINLQLLIEASVSKNYPDKSEYEEWRVSALKAARIKNKQIEYLRSYRDRCDKSEDSEIRAICFCLSDFILSLPAGVQVASEVMRDLIAIRKFIERSNDKRRTDGNS
jgi:hypothetical protein